MPVNNRTGGLSTGQGTLFDTNIPATSIDRDIFTDQEVLTTIASDDLVLMLDVSEDPDVIKYMTRANFVDGLSGGTITITDNESTDENNLIAFIANAATTTGLHGMEMDGDLFYNPSTGRLSATQLAGTLQTASQTNITGVGTITTGTWEGTTVAVAQGGTGATSLTNLITLATHTTGDYVQNITAGTGLTSSGATSGENIAHSLSVDASQTQITGVGTISTGTWEGDTVAITQGGTGATSLTNLFALGTHTTGNYVTDVSAGTLIDVSHTPGEGSTATVNVDLTEAAEAAIANGDYLLFLDGGATGTHAKEAVHDLATLFAGTGLTASSSVIGVDASQTQITAVGTIATGTWEGTTVAVAQGGTGATSLNNLITMGTHTSGDYVAAITAGTGLTSTGATSGETISHSLSVDASQSQITTVGTIGTGVWAATDVAVAHGGTGASTATAGFDALSPMTAEGDVLYGGSSGTVTKLAKGSDADVLTLASGIPSWATPTVGDITGVTAGVGLSGGGSSGAVTLTLDLSELSTVTPADGDFFSTLDSDGSNEQKTTTTALATLLAGTGISASSSVLSVDAAQTQITSVGTIGTGVWEGTTVAVAQGGTGATSLSNLITLGTHTTGNYAATITAGTGLTSTGATSGESIAHSLSVDASQGQITTVGALNAGSITSGFTSIDVGSGTIATTGVITAGGFTIGSAAILEAELEILDGATVTTTELNLLDGDTSVGGSITIADGDGFIVNDGGAMKTIPASDLGVYITAEGSMNNWVLEDGDGTEVTLTNTKEIKFVEGGGLDINWTDTDNGTDADPYDLTFTIDAAQTLITSIYATDLIMGEDTQTAIDFGTANEIDFKVDNAARLTMTSGALYPVTNNQIDLGTSSLEFKDAFFDGTVTADAFAGPLTGAVTGNADTVTTNANLTGHVTSVGNAAVLGSFTSAQLATALTNETGSGVAVFATSPTLITPALGTPASGVMTNVSGTAASLTAGTATVATTVTITDNESTDEANAIIFTAGGDLDGGNLGLESDGTLNYNPSSGTLTSTTFVGALTGNASGTAATVTGGTQASITSAANLVTVGTIGTGVWEGTTIAVDQGGTGATTLNNLITLGTHTSGNYAATITAGTGLTSTGATSGEGVAHSLSVDASQTQITSVGTITTGTWEGTTVAVAQGGTGATSLTNLITLATHTTGDYVQNITAGTGLTSSGATSGENIAHSLSVDAAQTQITSVGTLTGLTLDGDKSVTPGDGAMVHLDTSTITDSATAGSGTATKYTHVALEAPTLAATNASVTTSDAATLYINNAATAGTNQTITRNWAMWVDAGNARFDGSIYSGTTEALNSSGLVTVANQSNITGVSTITSGTWEGTTIAVAQGGTGATSLTNLITLATHTTGDYVQNITAGTGLTSTGATSGENIVHSLSVDASQTQITSVGALNVGSITSGFTSIDVGAGAIAGGSFDASDGNITSVGDIALDSISADATDISIAVTDNSATALTVLQGSDAYLIIDTANSSESVSIGTGLSGTAIAIGHGTSETTFGDNVTITGDLTINGATVTNATTNLTIADPLVKYGQAYVGSAYDQGFIVTRGNSSASNTQNMAFIWDESEDEFATIKAATEDGTTAGNVTVTDHVNLHVGALVADDTSTFSGSIELGHASDTTIARSGSGDITIEGNAVYRAGGTDVAVADGGTGQSNLNDLITLTTHTTGDYVGTVTAGTGLTSTGATSGEGVAHSLSVDAAQTAVTSIYATDLIMGEDSETAIDFGTANEIDFKINNTTELTLDASALYPTGDAGLDLGTSVLEFKDAFFDGTVTSDAFAGPLTGNVTGNADTATALAAGRTIAMTGDVAWTSASFDGSGDVTGAGTIQANAVEGSMLNNNTISGQTEITSGLAAADELLYDDGGVIKKIGLDNFVELTPALATEDAVADGDYFLFLDGGASGNMNKEAVHDLATLFAGAGMTATSSVVNVIGGDGITANANDVAITAAQTTITSIYATDLIMGEDAQTAIDFGTANEIDFKVDNAARLTLTSGALYPVTDNQIDLGTSTLEFKDAFFDGTVTADAFAGPLTGDVTGTASGNATAGFSVAMAIAL